MNWFRRTLRKSRLFVGSMILLETFTMVEGYNFVQAYEEHERKEKRLEEISELLDIPVERLRPDHDGLYESLNRLWGKDAGGDAEVAAEGLERVREVLREHEDQLAANPYRPQIEDVRRQQALFTIEGQLSDLVRLSAARDGRTLSEMGQRAMLRNLHHGLAEGLVLPPLPEGLPSKAAERHAAMQAKLDRLVENVGPIIARTQDSESPGTLAQKIGQLELFRGVELATPRRGERAADRRPPWRQVERRAATVEVGADRATRLDPSPATSTEPSVPRVVDTADKAGLAPEITALAQELGNSPARIFRWVHDEIALDPKWGSYSGALGTLWARSGTSWDQALLLRELLMAAGVDARLEWGEVEISTDTLVNLAGVDDPIRAGDLLTTAGMPIVLYTQGSQVVGARLSHVWIRAYLDYIPNRGVTPGPGDTWVRMDPSFSRFDYAPGIRIHDQVPFSLGDYLLGGSELSPLRAYQEALWAHIRANDIACTTLEQLKPAALVQREDFPFVPGTLRVKILSIAGEADEVPTAFRERLEVILRTTEGSPLFTWNTSVPATWSQRIELAWRGATAEDQATLDAMGGVFETPPYLVDLVPVLLLDGVEQGVGGAVGSAEDIEVAVTSSPANGPADVFVHQGYAGEPAVLVTAFGEVPQQLVARHRATRAAALASGDAALAEATTLQLLGSTYFQSLGRDAADIAGWTWHRLLRLVSEGLVVQTGAVGTAVDGSPLSFSRAESYVDFPGFVVGLFHATGAQGIARPTLELAGAQGSFLEGEVFDQVLGLEGLGAVSALTLAKRQGQSLERLDSANVDSVLAAVELGDEVEAAIRQAVGQGRVAWVPQSAITVNDWQGLGYVLADPDTGAAGYLITGGFAGGVVTEKLRQEVEEIHSKLGSEPWFKNSALGKLFRIFLGIFEPEDASGTGALKSDPVHMATGNFWQSVSDLTLTSHGQVVAWGRSYNSRSDYAGPMGHGWTFSYGEHLELQPGGDQVYREADGTEHLFELAGDGSYVSPPGKPLVLTATAAGHTLLSKWGDEKRFDTAGRLLATLSADGSGLTLDYDVSGQLSGLVDPSGRRLLDITSTGGLITSVRDLGGREVLYTYQDGDLVAVRDIGGSSWQHTYDTEHNLIGVVDPAGYETGLAYDALDRCIQRIDARGGVESFAYSSEGRRAVFVDRAGAETYLELDSRGRTTLEVDGFGNPLRSTWDDANNRLSTTLPRGGELVWTYDDDGNLLSRTDPEGGRVEYTYGPDAQVATLTDALGVVTTNTYDSEGRITSSRQTIDGRLYEEQAVYDTEGKMIEFIDTRGGSSTFEWDPILGLQTATTDPEGNRSEVTYDALGRVEELLSPGGERVFAEWDDRDQVMRLVDPQRGETLLTYDELGRLKTVTNGDSVTTLDYDEVGNPIRFQTPGGDDVRMEYDAADRLVARIDGRGSRTTFVYDLLGRQLARIDSTGATWTYEHCAGLGATSDRLGGLEAAGPCSQTDPEGNTTRRAYDDVGRVSEIVDPQGHITRFGYDAAGRRTSIIDPLGHERRFEYDGRNNLAAVVDENGGRTEYTYGLDDQIRRILDAAGREWLRDYDGLGRLTSETDPLGRTHEYRYDGLGNMAEITTPDGTLVTQDFEERRLVSRTVGAAPPETFTYDDRGRLLTASNAEGVVQFERDARGRVLREIHQALGQAVDYGWDANGNLVSLIGPAGEIAMEYDGRNRLVAKTDPLAGRFGFEYDTLGRRSKLLYPNGTSAEYLYDARSLLSAVTVRNAQGEVVDGTSYRYDARGQRIAATDLAAGVEEGFGYDPVGRLTSWSRGDQLESYGYDLVGNRITSESETMEKSWDYDDANQLQSVEEILDGQVVQTTDYQWDLNGSLVQKTTGGAVETFLHDATGRLLGHTVGGQTSSFFYDALGRRSRRVAGGQEERYLHARTGGLDQLLGIWDDQGSRQSYFVSGVRPDEMLAQVGDEVSYLHHDAVGSVRSVSTADGQLVGRSSYRPFGTPAESAGATSRFGYVGRESESDDLMFFRARFYQPDEGRFTSRDPVAGFASNPSSLHPYVYAFNSPSNFADPSGLLPEPIEVAIDFFTRGISTFIMLLAISADVLASYDNLALSAVSTSQKSNAAASMVSWFGKMVLLIGTAYIIYDILTNQPELTAQQAWVKIFVTIFLTTAGVYGMGLLLFTRAGLPRFNFRGFVAAAAFIMLLANVFITIAVTAIVDGLMYVLRFKYRVI